MPSRPERRVAHRDRAAGRDLDPGRPDVAGGSARAPRDTLGIEGAAWRAVSVFRWLTLIYAVAINLDDLDRVAHPAWCVATLVVMSVWTLVATAAYRLTTGWPLLAADMLVTFLTIVATVLVESPERIADGEFTVPSVWAVSAVIAWAMRGELVGGVAAAFVVAVANLLVDGGSPTRLTIHNVIIVFLAAVVVGFVMELARRAERIYAEAIRVRGAAAERDRLARQIHDGVLQVLALVRKRGTELGGDAADLASLAGEQETALRALVAAPLPDAGTGRLDLRELLIAAAGSTHVHLSAPADPVVLPAHQARELAAAVSAALHNVRAHVGTEADAWVLVEDVGDAVCVTVRDDGPGFAPERLAAAAAQGRLGVAQSIRGRLAELGGSATVTSAPGAGTEVELRVPRR